MPSQKASVNPKAATRETLGPASAVPIFQTFTSRAWVNLGLKNRLTNSSSRSVRVGRLSTHSSTVSG